MTRYYTISTKTASFTAAKTLVLLRNPSDQVCMVVSAEVAAPDDDTNEQLDLGFNKVTTIGSPTGAAVVATPHENGIAASGLDTSSLTELTAEPTTYSTSAIVGRAGASSLGGWRYLPTRDEALTLSPSENWGLRLFTAMGTSKALTVRVTFAEIGG